MSRKSKFDKSVWKIMKKNRRFLSHNVRAVCRDCKKEQTAHRSEFLRASRARCISCGGQLDKVRGRVDPVKGQDKSEQCDVDRLIYPKHVSEFEVQAYVYWTLKERGYDVRGEVVSSLRTKRLDLVVFSRHRVAEVIIEVKTYKSAKKKGYGANRQREKQLARYGTLGVRVDLVTSLEGARRYCDDFSLPSDELPPSARALREVARMLFNMYGRASP